MNYLEHFGRIGMRWGRRNAKKVSPKTARLEREKILKSPTRLYANRNKFSTQEINKAMERMKMDRELRGLANDKISSGSRFAGSFLSYGVTISTAYGLYKSPLGQTIKSAIMKRAGVSTE